MQKSDSIIKISAAILKAQREIGSATKGSTNPFFHSTYADLGAVMEACKDKLNDNGICVLQPVGSDDQGVYVETVLLHESGEFIADKMRISVKQQNDPQAQGSAITYARRYGLQSMVFIPAEDDDGEKAVNHETSAKTVFKTGAEQYTDSIESQMANHKANCPAGTPFKILVSASTNNFGRKYKKCTKCNAFLGWYAEEEKQPGTTTTEKVDPSLGF